MVSYSKFEHSNATWGRKYIEKLSDDYRVFVNGEEVAVYTCRISKMPFNRPWPGYQRSIDQTEVASFVNIVSDEAIDVKVVFNRPYERILLKPYSKGITYTDDGKSVSFTLTGEGQFVLSGDDLHNLLYIFNSKPVTCDDPSSVTYYFGPGVHMPRKIELHDNESVYVDKDALVFGCIYANGANNVRIFGNGLLDDSGEERFAITCYPDYTNGNMKFYDCRNVSIQGVLMRNSAIWCINVFHCFDVDVDNVKVFGQWRYNTDGVDIVNSQRITLRNSFVHSFDDTVTIKGIDHYITTDNVDILTENCVLMCDWGKCCEIGLETACREYKNIVFRNCDVIKACHTALDIQDGDSAEVHNVLFEDIRVELDAFGQTPIMQESDDQCYTGDNGGFVPEVIGIRNVRFRGDFYCNGVWGVPKDMAPLDLEGIQFATVHDVTFRNISVYCDERIPRVDGRYPAKILVSSCLKDTEHYKIRVEDMTVNGYAVSQEDVVLELNGVRDFEMVDTFAQLKKNTVESRNQLRGKKSVWFFNRGRGGKRVLFIGNSITLHGRLPEIGWDNEWGMAASSKKNDYVHRVMANVENLDPNAEYGICQVAGWEQDYHNGVARLAEYEEARDFNADIIVCRFVENVPFAEFDEEAFGQAYRGIVKYLDPCGKARIVMTDSFWKHPADSVIERIACENGYPLVKISDLGELDEMKAIGLFEHEGVAMHPGDTGMKTIADRIWEEIKCWI